MTTTPEMRHESSGTIVTLICPSVLGFCAKLSTCQARHARALGRQELSSVAGHGGCAAARGIAVARANGVQTARERRGSGALHHADEKGGETKEERHAGLDVEFPERRAQLEDALDVLAQLEPRYAVEDEAHADAVRARNHERDEDLRNVLIDCREGAAAACVKRSGGGVVGGEAAARVQVPLAVLRSVRPMMTEAIASMTAKTTLTMKYMKIVTPRESCV